MQTYNWGILAAGNIANALAQALTDCPQANLLAIGSRTLESATNFATHWQIPRAYGSYAELVADPDIDIIYIASPHSHHAEHMQLCLNAGKHVLCEKAFTLTADQAQTCINLARKNNLFLMEAMWMRFFPAIQQTRAWLTAGQIGTPILLQADFCLHVPYDPGHRLFNPDLGGSALLDLGIYPLSFATYLLGLPTEIASTARLAPTGVDQTATITLGWQGGALAQLACTSIGHSPYTATITGTHGYIHLPHQFFNPHTVILAPLGQAPQTHHLPPRSNGYIHEVEEVHACLDSGRTESDIMPLNETLALMQIMDNFRADWGVHYPADTP